MRKISRKYRMAVVMVIVLVLMALTHEDNVTAALILMGMATLVACVWIVSEARVDRAAAPLNIAGEGNPPESGQE